MRVMAFASLLSVVTSCANPKPPRTPGPSRMPASASAKPEHRTSPASPAKERAASPAPPEPAPRGQVSVEAVAPSEAALEVPGFDPAVVSFPAHRRAREPVLVAAHGAGDSPLEQCRAWREVLGDRGIVLCPAGPRVAVHSEGRYFPDHFALERIVFASLAAFRASEPDSSARDPVVYAGYSQGATMGALMIVDHGATCPRLALVEGGFDDWSLARAEKFKSGGGSRILVVCGTRRCRDHAEKSAGTLRRGGLSVRVVSDLSAGHTYGGAVARALETSFDWLVEDDPDWRAP